jgi:hypothetical protein
MRAASKENAYVRIVGGESSSDESQSIASVMRFAAHPFHWASITYLIGICYYRAQNKQFQLFKARPVIGLLANEVSTVISGGESSTTALHGSTETEQFDQFDE